MKLERGAKLGRGRSACATVRAEFSRREWSFAREETDVLDEMLVLEPLAHAQALEGTIDGRARDGGDDDGDEDDEASDELDHAVVDGLEDLGGGWNLIDTKKRE